MMRSHAPGQMEVSFEPARRLFCCKSCGTAQAFFKDRSVAVKGRPWTWLGIDITPVCSFCGNTSCVEQQAPEECKVLWPPMRA